MPDRRGQGWRSPLRIYLVLAPLFYLAFALLTPPFETPDEHQHLMRAWQLSEGQLIAERRGDAVGGEMPRGVLTAIEAELGTLAAHARRSPQALPVAERLARATPIDGNAPRSFTDFHGSAPYSPVGYGPQVLSIWIGKALGQSVEAIMQLGRALNALLTVALVALAMRMLPLGRNVLLLVGLLPMTSACAGSFGQDGLVIGTAALVLALGLRAAFERPWTRHDGLLAALIASALTLAKFVYLPLAAVGLFAGKLRQPRQGMARLKPALPPLIAVGIAGVLFLLWMAQVSGLTVAMSPEKPLPQDQLRYVLAHPMAFPSAFAARFSAMASYELSLSLVGFGWLQVGPVFMAWWPMVLATALVLLAGTGEGPRLSLIWRAWLALLVVAVSVILCFALYLGATKLGAAGVDGVQGRYFIPAFTALLIALGRQGQPSRFNLPLLVAGLMVLANLASLQAIFHAFYR